MKDVTGIRECMTIIIIIIPLLAFYSSSLDWDLIKGLETETGIETKTKTSTMGLEIKTAHLGTDQDQKFTFNNFRRNSKRQTKTSTSVFRDGRISTHADPTTCRTIFHEQCISSVNFTSAHVYANFYIRVGVPGHSSDFGLLGEQSSPKWEIPCPGRPWTTLQNLMPLALSSLEKSVTIQTNTKTNSKWYIHTLPIGMCW